MKSSGTWLKNRWEDFKDWQASMSEAADHAIAGHNVKYRADSEWFTGHTGCVICRECPYTAILEDGKHNDVVLWCRHSWTIAWVGQRVCSLLGHPLFQHPKSGGEYKDDEVYCYRCCFEAPLRKVWLDDEGQAEALDQAPADGAGTDQIH